MSGLVSQTELFGSAGDGLTLEIVWHGPVWYSPEFSTRPPKLLYHYALNKSRGKHELKGYYYVGPQIYEEIFSDGSRMRMAMAPPKLKWTEASAIGGETGDDYDLGFYGLDLGSVNR